jgi:hypothetical protein
MTAPPSPAVDGFRWFDIQVVHSKDDSLITLYSREQFLKTEINR